MPDCGRAAAERLRTRILQLADDATVTASIGVGVAGTHSLDQMVAVADTALYVAKRAGRDQVHTANAAAPSTAQPDDVRPDQPA